MNADRAHLHQPQPEPCLPGRKPIRAAEARPTPSPTWHETRPVFAVPARRRPVAQTLRPSSPNWAARPPPR